MVHKIFTENDKPILVYETILKQESLGSILLTYCNEKHILRTLNILHLQIIIQSKDLYKKYMMMKKLI